MPCNARMRSLSIPLLAALLAASPALTQTAALAQGDTLAQVKARGHLVCGVSGGVAGFSMPDGQGRWHGLDAGFSRLRAAL